jgi:anti-sigma B factor antagonist
MAAVENRKDDGPARGRQASGTADMSVSAEYPLQFGEPPIMRGRLERVDDVVTLILDGEFDLVAIDAFTTTMIEIEATNPRGIVVNVQGLSFMDSTGIKGLVEAHRRASGAHSFAVLNGSGPAHRTLQLVGLDQVLVMVDDASELPPIS